jgi:hypothetical protein
MLAIVTILWVYRISTRRVVMLMLSPLPNGTSVSSGVGFGGCFMRIQGLGDRNIGWLRCFFDLGIASYNANVLTTANRAHNCWNNGFQ